MTKQKEIYFFNPLRSPLLGVFVAAHTVFAIMLGRIHAFAPDETTYMKIALDAFTSGYSTNEILGWRWAQVWFLRTLYFPDRALRALGVPDYLSIRLLAILLSAAAVYLLLCLLRSFPSRFGSYLLAVILFVPSTFLWMSLGLRECFIFFSLALICTGIFLLSRNANVQALGFLVCGNLILFETKAMLFLIIVGASGFTFIFNLLKSRRVRVAQGVLLASVLIPIAIFPVGSKITYYTLLDQFAAVSSTGKASVAEYAEEITSSFSENIASTSSELSDMIEAEPNNPMVRILKILGVAKKLEAIEPAEGASPQTTERSSRLDFIPASISDPFSILKRTGGFLFTPFPLIDNGSFFLNILAFEAPGWWLLYGAFGLALWRRFTKRTFDELTVFVLSFSLGFLLFSALTEINVGTLARHRSVLLIPILFLYLSTSKSLLARK